MCPIFWYPLASWWLSCFRTFRTHYERVLGGSGLRAEETDFNVAPGGPQSGSSRASCKGFLKQRYTWDPGNF